jgi:hypothetical protein
MPLNQFKFFQADEPLTGGIVDTLPARLLRILWLQCSLWKRYTTLWWVLQHENEGVCVLGQGLVRASYQIVIHDLANNVIVNIKWVQLAVDVICIS